MSWSLTSSRIEPKISNLPSGSYGIYVDSGLTREAVVESGDAITLSVTVDGNLKDVVIVLLGQ